MATIEDLQKLDMRIGTFISVEEVEGSEKLYKEIVDFGEEIGKRQIVSGIRKFFTPEELINKQALFVINLEPRSIMGLESQGMLLATDNENGVVLLTPADQSQADQKYTKHMAKRENQNIQVNMPNIPILYTDMVFMNVNEDGVIIDICQKSAAPNQFQVVSRIGMSKEHAKKFVKKLSEIIALTTAHTTTEGKN